MVLLNLDAGEHDDETEDLWALADVLSVACGGHAGDERSMERVVAFCASRSAPGIGAHPSYPDREGFGRRTIEIDPCALRASIAEQCAALAAIAASKRQRVRWVKPHGALYHDAANTLGLAGAIVYGAREALGNDITIIGPPRGHLYELCLRYQFPYSREGFADRATRPDGTLVPRGEPNALVTEPTRAAARAGELVAAGTVETICVHADTPGSLPIVRAVREALDEDRR